MTELVATRSGWHQVRLGDLCRIEAPQVDPRQPEFAGWPLVNGENLDSGIPRLRGVKSAAEEGVISPKYLFEPGDVLYSKLRPYLRKVAVAPFRGVCSADMYPLRPVRELVEPHFLAWLLLGDEFTAYASDESRRARMPKLNREQLFSWQCTIPEVDIQRTICEALSESLALVARARVAAEASLEATAALPEAFLRGVFNSAEAAAWPLRRIRELGDPTRADVVQTGPFGAQLPSSEFVPEGVPVLHVGNVRWGRLDLSSLDHVGVEKANDLARYRLQRGDVLFTRSGSVGRCAVVPPEVEGCLMSYHLLRVAIDQHRIEPEYLAAAIRGAPEVRRQVLVASKRGSTRGGVNTEFLSELRVPLPDCQEQLRIARDLQGQMAAAERLRNSAEMELAAINSLPAALLRQAFSGEL